MINLDEYLKGVLKQILDSYAVIDQLSDKPGDLEIINREWLKIFGQFRVIINKLEKTPKNPDIYLELLKRLKHYVENNDFGREINTMAQLYSTDINRLKNIRLKILDSLNERNLMEKVVSITNEL